MLNGGIDSGQAIPDLNLAVWVLAAPRSCVQTSNFETLGEDWMTRLGPFGGDSMKVRECFQVACQGSQGLGSSNASAYFGDQLPPD